MTEWIWKEGKREIEVRERSGVCFLAFPALDRLGLVRHGFSTRLGGVSQGEFATMNLGFTRGDEPGRVLENYRRMAEALGVDWKRMVLSHQTHTTCVRRVTEEDEGKGITRPRDYTDVDGLITNVPGLTLVTFYADCVPLYFVDPENRAVGLSHSGWRGTVHRMGKATLEAMAREFGTRPEKVTACIGPSICQSCFEVGEEVAAEFAQAFGASCQQELFYRKENGKYQLDLWKANERVLLDAGVCRENIHVTNLCTRCNPDRFFSHRAMGNRRGNLAAFLGLKEKAER